MIDKETKPVAWMYTDAQGKEVIVKADVAPYEDAVPLYTVPQPETKPWVYLSEEDIEEILAAEKFILSYNKDVGYEITGFYLYAHHIEAKLKELNT